MDNAKPYQQVARGAVEEAPRAACIGGKDPADRGTRSRRGIEWQELALPAEVSLDLAEQCASLDSGGQVGRFMFNDSIEPRQPDKQIELLGNAAQRDLRPASPGHHRQAIRGGQPHDLRELLQSARKRGGARRLPVHGVPGTLLLSQDVRCPDDRRKPLD
jgi:hypothetical protein